MMMSADLAAERYRLLLEQLSEEGLTQRDMARVLGVTQGAVSFYLREERRPDVKALTSAMDRLGIHQDFFFDATLERPHYSKYLQDSYVQPEREDTAAWLQLEESGAIDEFRKRLPEQQIQQIRAIYWDGIPAPRDYVRLLEAASLGPRGEVVEMAEARRRLTEKKSSS